MRTRPPRGVHSHIKSCGEQNFGKLKTVLEMIDKARENVDKEIQNPMYNDSEYLIQLEMDSQELDLLEAVCYMRQGKYFKAKKQLKNIVRANGYYLKEAKNLIDSI